MQVCVNALVSALPEGNGWQQVKETQVGVFVKDAGKKRGVFCHGHGDMPPHTWAVMSSYKNVN